jgi:hypothetical protein
MAVGVVIWGGVLRHGRLIAGLWRGRKRGFACPIGTYISRGVRAALSGNGRLSAGRFSANTTVPLERS